MFDNISVPGAVAIAILVVLVLIVIVRNIYIVQQSRAYVVERDRKSTRLNSSHQ